MKRKCHVYCRILECVPCENMLRFEHFSLAIRLCVFECDLNECDTLSIHPSEPNSKARQSHDIKHNKHTFNSKEFTPNKRPFHFD